MGAAAVFLRQASALIASGQGVPESGGEDL